MNACVNAAGIVILVAASASARGAEDHSNHRGEAQPSEQRAEHGHDHASHGSTHELEPGESERAHVPPDPPVYVMGDMSTQRMIELMQMEDDAPFGMVLLDQLEWQRSNDADVMSWELDAWYGDDYDKLWFETEGERLSGETEGRVEIMWDRIVSPWWSVQTGLRHDIGSGPSRTWIDLGVQGTSPCMVEIDAAIYIGEQGRLAARFSSEYDVLITQRLVLQPELELRAYSKDDPENRVGSGLSDIELALRLRYEIRREVAPYLGVRWKRRFGRTADLAREHGEGQGDVAFVAGVRAWF
jgi:copper resistance protein B